MSVSKDTEGNWIWYVNKVKEHVVISDYKELMKKYMSGVPFDKVIEEMKK